VAATYDGKHMRIYRNGEEVASANKHGAIDTDSTTAAAIGNQPPGAGDLPFDGLIDDVRIYDRALSATEIDSLVQYRVNVGVDGNGTVGREPAGVTYMDGVSVVFTAMPAAGWTFQGWSDGLSGSENPDTLVVAGDTTVTAVFQAAEAIPTLGAAAAVLLATLLAGLGAMVMRGRGLRFG
jgi:hypothetical protein